MLVLEVDSGVETDGSTVEDVLDAGVLDGGVDVGVDDGPEVEVGVDVAGLTVVVVLTSRPSPITTDVIVTGGFGEPPSPSVPSTLEARMDSRMSSPVITLPNTT